MEPINGCLIGVLKIIFLSNWMILRFHVNFQGCISVNETTLGRITLEENILGYFK